MTDGFVTRGFTGRRLGDASRSLRVPPGQYETPDFPVLSTGPTPRIPLDRWTFTIEGLVRETMRWSWPEFLALPAQEFVVDIHCVTKWSKLGTRWKGVSIDTLLEHSDLHADAQFVVAYSHEGYTTNLPLPDIRNGRAFIAYEYEGLPLAPSHGGPARLMAPALYFWKSAKWIAGLRITGNDEPGFWETAGYHNHGDPWKEERYAGD